MYIVLDTNIFFNDWMFRKELAQAFLDYLRKTRSRVMLPRVVLEEIRVNYRQELESKISEYEKACRLLNNMSIDSIEFKQVDINIDDEVDKYIDFITEELRMELSEDIIDYNSDLLERVSNRAIHKTKPFTGTNEREFKDTLIWETVLDVVQIAADNYDDNLDNQGVIFFSNDHRAYSVSKEKPQLLHSQLKSDLGPYDTIEFHYYTGFEKFVAEHHTPIAAITKDVVLSHITSSNFAQKHYDDYLINIDEISNYIRDTNPNLEFNNIQAELLESREIDSIKPSLMFIYLYKHPERTIIFQRLHVTKKAEVTYYDPAVSVEPKKITLTMSFRVKVTIPFEDGLLKEVSVDTSNIMPSPGILILRLPSITRQLRRFRRRI